MLNIKQRNVFRQITVDIFVAQMTGRDGTCYSECSGWFCSRANCYVKPETACRLVLCRRFSIQGPYSATIHIFCRFLLFVNAASIASLCSEATYCFLEPADEATSLTRRLSLDDLCGALAEPARQNCAVAIKAAADNTTSRHDPFGVAGLSADFSGGRVNEPESGLKHAPLGDKHGPRGRYALLRHWKQTRLAKSGGVGNESFSSAAILQAHVIALDRPIAYRS